MHNGHEIKSLNDMYSAGEELLRLAVNSDDVSADSILATLNSGIEILKEDWKGLDAGVQINSVVKAYNAMIDLRNALAKLAVKSMDVVVSYRETQNFNAASGGEFARAQFDSKTKLPEYSDTTDAVKISTNSNNGKTKIDDALNAIAIFTNKVNTEYAKLESNWINGPGRQNLFDDYNDYKSVLVKYQSVLAEVSQNITVAIQNYGL